MSGIKSIIQLPLDWLTPNPWNPNQMDDEQYGKALNSIREFGFVDPVTVRELGNDTYQIIDGEHRWRAARTCGLDDILVVNLGPVPDQVAKKLTITLNELRGQAEPKKLGALLADLLAGEPKERLLATLPYSKEAFDTLSGLPTLRFDDLQLPPKPTLNRPSSGGWVERTFRLPKDSSERLDAALNEIRERGADGLPEWQLLDALVGEFLRGA
jgi:hypothetical protein